MSTRGVKFNFEAGEHVLCFEPDLSKARVLYGARVLEQTVNKDRHGRRRPEYLIHFQGWNSGWDRLVVEEFVLKDTEETRLLMKRLAQIVRLVRNNKGRKRRIDCILKTHFKSKLKFDSSDNESSSGEDDADGSADDETTDCTDSVEDGMRNSEDDEVGPPTSTDEDEESDEVSDTSTDLDDIDQESKVIDLPIPDKLREILEDDNYFITRKKKLVNLPADPNVISLLEEYVKNFALNILCGTEKCRPHRDGLQPPERNIEMCKQVVDGLRVFFDFALPTVLLYNFERAQYTSLSTSFRPSPDSCKNPLNKNGLEPTTPTKPNSPRLRSASKNLLASPSGPVSPKILCLSPRSLHREDEYSDSDDGAYQPRRITRQQFAEDCKKRRQKQDRQTSNGSESGGGGEPSVTPSRRGRRGSKGVAVRKTSESSSSGRGGHARTAGRGTPPPPLVMPAGSVSPNRDSSEGNDEVDAVLSWRLLPPEAYEQHPAPPSLIYGPHHLLRLFVKLPEYLGQMRIPETKLSNLTKHLELFLSYLNERTDELLPGSVYVNDTDITFGNTKQTGRR